MLVKEAHDWQSRFNARNNTANSENVSWGYLKKNVLGELSGFIL